jgi:hypothetical protein
MIEKPSFKKPPFTLDRSRSGTLVEQIASALRTAVETGYYKAGDMLPPTRDLAALLGVSRVVAIRAVRRLADERLVIQRPHAGSVVCAKESPLWKGQVLVVVPPGQGNPIENTVYAVLRDSLTAAGYLTISATVSPGAAGRYDDFALLDTVMRQQIDFVVELENRPAITRWLSRRGVPFLRFAHEEVSIPNCVGTIIRRNDLAVASFVARCRKEDIADVLQVKAWRGGLDVAAVLKDAGIRVRTLQVPMPEAECDADTLVTWAVDTFQKRLAGKRRDRLPDLVFFQDDHLATGALMAFLEAGVRIPGDVRVATWANRRYGPHFTRPLARMEMDNDAIGNALSSAVLEYLATGAAPKGVVVGPSWIEGESF